MAFCPLRSVCALSLGSPMRGSSSLVHHIHELRTCHDVIMHSPFLAGSSNKFVKRKPGKPFEPQPDLQVQRMVPAACAQGRHQHLEQQCGQLRAAGQQTEYQTTCVTSQAQYCGVVKGAGPSCASAPRQEGVEQIVGKAFHRPLLPECRKNISQM